ncbi:MAG TPA: D-alanyl-D-alanine carboxypeptidase family protein [Ktedonobacteraceae bacterium]|nr:D-alanyl-D-alanine carboxypeptidase family protein [Ktedonobacteraceae bacterium]
MYKPPQDDEQFINGEHDEDDLNRTSYARPKRNTPPRKSPAKSRREFYADEHPEIPRIRRASLNQPHREALPFTGLEEEEEPATQQPEEATPHNPSAPRRRRREIPPTHEFEEENRRPPHRRGESSPYTRMVRRQNRQEMLPFTGLETDIEDEQETGARTRLPRSTRPTRRVSQKIGSYAPVTPEPRTARRLHSKASSRRSHRSSPAKVLFFGRRRSWLLIGMLAVVVLIGAPLLINAVRNIASQQNPNMTTVQGISLAQLQSVPSNPHELVIVPPTSTHPAPPIMATAAYLLDADNATTYYAQNPFLHLPMLSTTKLMTAALAVENGDLDQKITISAAMIHDINGLSADSALFGVKQGDTYTLRDLIYGLLYASGNDAALVIADALSGNVANFVERMNQKAQELGLHDTHFVNPHGLLNAGQYSCARDLAVLGLYSLSIPVLQKISAARTYHIPAGGKHGERVLLNENQFLWWYPGVNGGKTGYDGGDDFIQVMMVTRNHRHMVGVVMHTNNWWTDMRNLVDYGSNDYTWVSPREVNAAGQPIPFDSLWNYFSTDQRDSSIPTANGGQYYSFSGYSISGPILSYFKKQGGLKKFGYPIKMPVPSGGSVLNQQFEKGKIQCDFSSNKCQTA